MTGEVYRLKGEPDKAVMEYLKVPYLYPGLSELELEARLQAASVYLKKGNKSEAVKLLKIIIDHPEAGRFKGIAEERLREIGG
jgi:tetratricopeptide (TPR) repeat protein